LGLRTLAAAQESKERTTTSTHPLEKILAERIAIIDGAMGTAIRKPCRR